MYVCLWPVTSRIWAVTFRDKEKKWKMGFLVRGFQFVFLRLRDKEKAWSNTDVRLFFGVFLVRRFQFGKQSLI